ncbi:DUF3413 domain-containing protein [Vibrio cincinnatiensis]|uniref:DUF3413 domain-containing protein n=1 Tax=Vibrio cincinnatiensis TaxID=675 RepID=UPI0012AD1E50|nr:DUF3413 domain-containing protein [Vibrio cincinnatiensis]MCG3722876.1 DUF3413 domain-containing protein [Vibrio cincinnatiensis]MCG3731667.1 DUF3413 domain-containing protein [Vibrio cincinnatiensis]MCG3736944.1 DUF3413 domain-containing protein [Vibrio cincinnatiensis]MCG3738349.1 DUF3413 domain-containing protein [Vibrio cincinnatiensis]MCG3747481.1 DUF3413 domain-containing protein [Vibrio cincinnatiensis]
MVDSGNTYGERVSRLVSWGHWFAFFNIIAAMLIGTRYITQTPWPDTLLGQFYLAFSWVGHFGFLVFALYLLILFPLTFLIPSRMLFRFIAVCFATLGLTVLLIDTQTYQTINLHLTPVVWELLFSDESSISADLQHLFVVLPLIFLLQLGLSEWVWRKQRRLSHKRVGRPLAAVFFISFITSHVIYVWSDAYFYAPVTSQKSNFPLSYPMTAKSFMEKHGLLDRDKYLKRLEENQNSVDLVNYPLEKIEFGRRANHLNILIASVDSLRADVVTEHLMPNTYQFANNALTFSHHFSSSNDMYGMFGLFYGLPSSYASSIKVQGTLPILIDALKNQKYQFGLFSSDNFSDPLFQETVFRGLPLIQTPFEAETSHDRQTIQRWGQWVQEQNSPWLSFIELTTVSRFNSMTISDQKSTATDRLRNSYYESVTQADHELALLYAQLESLQLLDNTIVVITSNHGTEFNETKTNSWGANSNYSRYQLQVPMIVYWPGKMPATFTHRSSHLDFSVTLLQDLLGVSSNPNDFSSGKNLFNENKRRWILAGDSRELALITEQQTTVIDKFGNFKLYDENYQRLTDENPTLPILMQGLTELQRFYSKDN